MKDNIVYVVRAWNGIDSWCVACATSDTAQKLATEYRKTGFKARIYVRTIETNKEVRYGKNDGIRKMHIKLY